MPKVRPSPWLYFSYDLLVIAVLVFLAVGNSARPVWSDPPFGWPSFAFDRVMPLWVPWGGALGGVTISLVGVAQHAFEWDAARYRYWHISRPVLGAISGTMSVLILVFVLRGVAPEVGADGFDSKGVAILTAIAFVIGYREETFRELIKRVVDLVLRPTPVENAGGGVISFVPYVVDFGAVAVGAAHTKAALLFNGSSESVAVDLANLSAGPADLRLEAAAGQLAPRESWSLDLVWSPQRAGVLNHSFDLTAGGRRVNLLVRGTAA